MNRWVSSWCGMYWYTGKIIKGDKEEDNKMSEKNSIDSSNAKERMAEIVKEKNESYKYLFEFTKHLTTLNTGLILFLTAINTGIITQYTPDSRFIWLGFGSFLLSTISSTGTMFQIASNVRSKRDFFDVVFIPVSTAAAFITFLMGLGFVMLAAH